MLWGMRGGWVHLGRALCGASNFGAGPRRARGARRDGVWACAQGVAAEHEGCAFSTPAGTCYVDLLNDHLWRACDEVVPEIRLVVPEMVQIGRLEEKVAGADLDVE